MDTIWQWLNNNSSAFQAVAAVTSAVVTVALAILTALYVLLTRRLAVAAQSQTQGAVYERLYYQNLSLLTFLAAYPELYSYFYDCRKVYPALGIVLQDRIRIVAEMYVGFLELIALQLDQLPDTVRAEYKKFILDAYRLSPAIRQCLKEHDSWYSQVLHTIITEAKMEKLEEKHIKPLLRPMSVHDLDALMEIQHDAYEQRFHEDRSFFVNKLNLFPSGCWVCTIHDVVVAYLFSFPIEYSNPPALNREMERLPKASDCYYVHDLAVRRAYQGIHIGKLLAEKVRELASKGGYHQMALIAVQRSQPFWMKHAFVIAPESQQITYKLLSYGEDACYMHCDCSTDLQSHV